MKECYKAQIVHNSFSKIKIDLKSHENSGFSLLMISFVFESKSVYTNWTKALLETCCAKMASSSNKNILSQLKICQIWTSVFKTSFIYQQDRNVKIIKQQFWKALRLTYLKLKLFPVRRCPPGCYWYQRRRSWFE